MHTLRSIAVLALLSASGADAAGLSTPSNGFLGERRLTQFSEAEQKHRDGWRKLCFGVPDAGPEEKVKATQRNGARESMEVCYTYSELRDPITDLSLGAWGVLKIQATGRTLLAALLQFFEATPREAYILLDGTTQVKLGSLATACDVFGCQIRAEMPHALLDRMKIAKSISFDCLDAMGHTYPAPLPCCGFGAALDGAPVPVEAQDETQREIQKLIRRRFADFTRQADGLAPGR